ncbi:polysaccharide deacetylase family protein [Paenibacillus hodogayensis]|uniref:Polysaccharide deacetylase family protein n=1 Tax=Paenibacillus hodogayensis TaxID=279208 RepID=A0ABV5VQU6_9BACL
MGTLGKSLIMTICLTTAVFGSAYSAPSKKGRDYYEARGDIVWEVPTDKKVIALTFDDGPDPTDTPEILALLRQYEAKATFFVVGQRVEKYPELVRQEVLDGHEIANHTYSHKYMNNRKRSADHIDNEISKTEQSIVNATGQKPHLFRPPGGYYNEQVVNASKKAGYTVVLWSWHQDTEDWNTPGVGKIVNKVLNNARNGDIVLFHDYVEGKTQTVAALKQILPELRQRGFQFITVSELLTHRKAAAVEK